MKRIATTQNPINPEWTEHESHALVVHDLACVPCASQAPWRRVAGFLLVLAVLALGSGAHAGGKTQGKHFQGLAYQSTKAQDSRAQAGWGEGDRLIGWFPGKETARSTLLEIKSFQGAVVHGTIHDFAASVSRSVELRPEALTGMHWQSPACDPGPRCAPVMYRIASASPDSSSNTMPGHSSNHDIWLYEVEFTDSAAPLPGNWRNICDLRAGSGKRGVFVNGRWNKNGTWNPSGYTFSCPGGVIAKCVRGWGYKPWKKLGSAEHGEVGLLPLHLACIRAARADYCGDGTSHTRDGTLIDIADRYGFNIHEGITGFQNESAFGPDGAYWVRAPRWPTGRRVTNGWLFSTCKRPNAAHEAIAKSPLLYVQSKTSSHLPRAND